VIHPLSPSHVDGKVLRRDLTRAAHEHSGDETAQRAAAVVILKAAWASGRERTRAELEAGAGGLETARALSRVADELVSALYDFTTVHVYRARNPTEGERLAICAGGGYGRGELAPFSDLDLHFVRAYKMTPWIESVIETMLYALYDLGVAVGSSARSIEQAVALSKKDWTVLTNLFDLRRIAGDAEHPEELARRLRDEVFQGRAREFVAAKLTERDSRLARQGASRYMVEPEVKEGKGGLRDLQTLDWLARGVAAARGESAAAALLFQREESRRYERASDFLWRVRAFMHFTAARAQDRLTFDLQPEVARLMGYEDAENAPAVERFMREYFLIARDVGALTRILCTKLEAEEEKAAPKGIMGLLTRRPKAKPLDDERFTIQAGRVSFSDTTLPEREPATMIALFSAASKQNADVHPDALSLVNHALDRMDDHARSAPETAEAFFDVLLRPKTAESALRLMNESGLLGAVVPEFDHIVGRTQFNMYHHYTVDEHTLRVIGGLAALEVGKMEGDTEFARSLFAKLSNRRCLYLAALLHDVGKGEGDQQIEGARLTLDAARRLGLSGAEVRLTSWLVGSHLEMSDFAQRRDLGDPRTVVDFIKVVSTTERLRLLTLLTIADINAVGPGVWTPWKRRLIHDLYSLTEAAFRGGRATAEQTKMMLSERADSARAALLAQTGADALAFTETWTARLEDAYWLEFDAESHVRHRDFGMSAATRGEKLDVDARWDEESGGVELLVLSPDRTGLFAALTGAIANSSGDVRAARLYTAADSTGLEFYLVTPPTGSSEETDGGWLADLKQRVLDAAGGRPPATPQEVQISRREAVFEVRSIVTFDNDASEEATVIEVSGRDRPGLLVALATALAEMGIGVTSANVESIGERAMDVFYAVEPNGGKIVHASRRGAIKRRLLAALEDADSSTSTEGTPYASAPASAGR